MFTNVVRYATRVSAAAIVAGILAWGAYQSTLKSLQFPTEAEFIAPTNISARLSSGAQKAVVRSRQSAIQVFSFDLKDGGVSAMTGTYVTLDGKYFVLTAAHGLYGGCLFTNIVAGEEFYNCSQLVLVDRETDYAVIQVEKINERIPVQIETQTPHLKEWVSELAAQNTVFYTGYPNEGGPYTFDGRVVGYDARQAIFIDSYGWSGSSGAGVFSESGNLIGWVMALEVGKTSFGRQVLENFIWVIPLFKVDWIGVAGLAD
jgi:hypothetical protein